MRHLAAAFLTLWLAGCGQPTKPSQPASAAKAIEPVKITHFYAGSPEVESGATVGFCYGVENARSVRIEPEVEVLEPGYNRCFYIPVQTSATYRLLAEGMDGSTASRSVTVKVKPAPHKKTITAANRGVFTMIFASAPEVAPGDSVTLCYGAPEARAIRIDPPVQELKPAERYCFQVKPERTTLYTFTATSHDGNAETATLNIKVR